MATCADVLIVGGGPAALSAALTLCRQVKSAIVFDHGIYRNRKSQHMHTILTWDHKDVKDFRAAGRKEIMERYKTTLFVDEAVTKVEKLANGHFQASTGSRSYTAQKVILAPGVEDLYPDIKGYAECWGSSVFHCLFCHGYEERGGEQAGVLAVEAMADKTRAISMACMIKNLAKAATIYTNDTKSLADEIRADALPHGVAVDDRKIQKLEKVAEHFHDLLIHLDDGAVERLSFMQHTPRTKVNGLFHEQLSLEMTAEGDYKTSAPFNETSMSGVFAAGDCGGMFKHVSMALTGGSMAAVGAVHQLSQGL